MANDILRGAVDMHCHAGPSLMPRDLDYVQAAQEADEAGMRAIVVKDHLFPSAVSLSILESRRDELFEQPVSVEILGSICLNSHVGGLNPYALEVALERGARVVWLPTVSARGHIEHRMEHPPTSGPFARLNDMRPIEPVPVMNEHGEMLPELYDIFELIKKYDVVMATGHLSPQETLAVVPKAREYGLERIVVTHPTIEFVNSSPDEMLQMARLGVYFEHEIAFWNPTGNRREPIESLVSLITDFGPGQTILSSDLGQLHAPHPVEGMSNVGTALADSLPSNDVDSVFKKNQSELLGLSS